MAEPLMTRRHSMKALIWPLLLCVLLGVALSVAAIVTGLWWLGALAPLPLIYILVVAWFARLGAEYRLFQDRLEIERGVFTRRIENVELFRIRDMGLQQGFVGRLGNFGAVHVHSTDASAPAVVLPAIDQPREFYQSLRELVTQSRAHRQTMIVEGGQQLGAGDGCVE